MWRVFLTLLLLAAPAAAQVKPTPKGATTVRDDPCAPIGRTSDGKLVYSMKCETLPAPPPTQAEIKEAPQPVAEPEPEVRRSGIFGWSYDRR